jgi:ribosomal protein L14
MIQLKTLLNCIDNSGASIVECVNVLKKKRPATIGDRIVVVVQKQRSAGSEATTAAALASKVRRGDIRHAVVVRVKKELQRPDGSLVRFGDNACVLVNKSGDPIGTRMNGKCSRGV